MKEYIKWKVEIFLIQINKTNELISLLKANQFIIYGTGVVGKRFYHGIRYVGIEKNILAFVVSEKTEETTFGNVPLKTIYDSSIKKKIQDETCIICVAVHEVNCPDIVKTIKSINEQFNSYIWVAPFIMDILFGDPVYKDKEVLVTEIFKNKEMVNDLGLACRWAAIEEFYGLRLDGYALYIKGMTTYLEQATARNRLNRFVNMLKNRDTISCYDNILIDSSYNLLDGRHRLVLGIYQGKKKIKATVYRKPYVYDNDQKPIVTNVEYLLKHGLESDEICKLKDVMKAILSKVYIDKIDVITGL